jgi:ABC-type sugar transport system substrate-binding protein
MRQDGLTSALRYGLLVSESDAQNNSALQVEQIQNSLRAPEGLRPRAILVAPVEDGPLRAPAREAARLGVTWVSLNRACDYVAELRREFPLVGVFSVQPDQDQIGRIQAEQVRLVLPEGGEVAYIRGPPLTVSADQRAASFRGALGGTPVRVTPLSANWSVEGGGQALKHWLSLGVHGSAARWAIVAQNDSMAYGARLALEEAFPRQLGESKTPVLGCNGARDFGLRLVIDGTLTSTVIVPSPVRTAMETLAVMFAGGPPPHTDINISVSSFPELSALASLASQARKATLPPR